MMLQLLVSCAGTEPQKVFEWCLGDAELIHLCYPEGR